MAHRITKMGKINFVVRDLDRALDFFEDVFQAERLRRRGRMTIGDFAGANILVGGFVIDLACPDDDSSPLGRVLATRGEGFLSLCLEVECFEDSVTCFASKGLPVTNRVEFMENKIGFIPAEHCCGVLIEIIERPAWWTWRDAELTLDTLTHLAELSASGRGTPRPLP